jgi:hypothetical protein
MSHAEAPTKLEPTIRGNGITADGIVVQIIAEGPGIGPLERILTKRNHRRWCAGKRPNKYGIWR